MIWSLLPHLTACVSRDDVMLLDLRQDRYFRVPKTISREVGSWLDAGGDPPDHLITILRQHRVLRRSERAGLQASGFDLTISERQLTGGVPPPAATLEALAVAACVATTWTALRLRPLQALIGAVRFRRTTHSPASVPTSCGRLAAYERSRRLVPIKKNCLLDSLALDRWLGDEFPDRRLVFGVTFDPFLAHCWLQTPELLLNESYDRARRFTPILVA